jgi:hypothetical protein
MPKAWPVLASALNDQLGHSAMDVEEFPLRIYVYLGVPSMLDVRTQPPRPIAADASRTACS